MASQVAEVKKMVRTLERAGWRIVRKKSGWQAFPPDKSKPPVTFHTSNSDHRWKANTIRDLRKAGYTGDI